MSQNTDLMVIPFCRCGRQLELRPREHQTYEQLWCGVWYDCPACGGLSVCLPSEAMAALYARNGQHLSRAFRENSKRHSPAEDR